MPRASKGERPGRPRSPGQLPQKRDPPGSSLGTTSATATGSQTDARLPSQASPCYRIHTVSSSQKGSSRDLAVTIMFYKQRTYNLHPICSPISTISSPVSYRWWEPRPSARFGRHSGMQTLVVQIRREGAPSTMCTSSRCRRHKVSAAFSPNGGKLCRVLRPVQPMAACSFMPNGERSNGGMAD